MSTKLRLAFAISLLFALPGCRDEGAAEKAGREMDEAVEDVKAGSERALEKIGRETDEAVEEVKEAVEEVTEGDE